jgi:chemotaxis methyl-accepting protein methylase
MTEPSLDKFLRIRILGKSPVGAFLGAHYSLWPRLAPSFTGLAPVRAYGRAINALVRHSVDRTVYFGTFFLRNRPQIEMIRRLSYRVERNSGLNLSILGCSNGAEVYSILSVLKKARPELKIVTHAVDISPDVVAIAKKGAYSISSPELVGEAIFQRLSDSEIEDMCERSSCDHVTIRPWISQGIDWQVGDVRDPEVLKRLGPQDIVVANNFLCHMGPAQAEECLLGIAKLVRPGGYLVVSGVDLPVRKRVAMAQGWQPVAELLEEVHNGDSALRKDWPVNYWGLEPLDKSRRNWVHHYAAIFQIGNTDSDPGAGLLSKAEGAGDCVVAAATADGKA